MVRVIGPARAFCTVLLLALGVTACNQARDSSQETDTAASGQPQPQPEPARTAPARSKATAGEVLAAASPSSTTAAAASTTSSGTVASSRRLIEMGWDEPDTRFMRQHITVMEQAPFDGCVFHILYTRPDGKPGNFTWEFWGKRSFNATELQHALDDLKATRFRRF